MDNNFRTFPTINRYLARFKHLEIGIVPRKKRCQLRSVGKYIFFFRQRCTRARLSIPEWQIITIARLWSKGEKKKYGKKIRRTLETEIRAFHDIRSVDVECCAGVHGIVRAPLNVTWYFNFMRCTNVRRSHRERHKMCALHKSMPKKRTVLIISRCSSDFKECIN